MTTIDATIYISIVYSHPNDPRNHKQVLGTLEHDFEVPRNKGHIIMRDFNARCPEITGDKVGPSNSHSPRMVGYIRAYHSARMVGYIRTCELTTLTNVTQQAN